MEREDLTPLGDAELVALFKSAGAPAPPPDFAARTMRAVRLAPLPQGRKPLGDPLASLVGWAAVIAAVAFLSLAIVTSQPVFASGFTALISRGVGTGVWLMQFNGAALALADVFATTGLAVARAAATREGTTGLAVVAAIGALSLMALHRLLNSEGEEGQWPELS